MKASSLALLLLVSSAATTLAQTSQVPNLLSYQASVTDIAGNSIGANNPVNRTVTFQFYTTSTGGTPVYAESQVVTIANGDFSILLGNGNGVSGLPGRVAPASPIISLASITLSPLYLGITVDDGTAAVDAEISPRQQLASAAFATRAQIAEGLADGKLATGMVADSAITTVKIGGNQVTTAKIADANITTAKLATGSITVDKLDTTAIGVWTPNGPNIDRTSGNVGIGEPNPGFPLNFASTTGNKIGLLGTSGAHYGLGVQSNLLQLYTSASSADVAFGYGSSTAFTETMRIKGNGNLGIGTNDPTSKLHVVGGSAILDSTSATALSVLQGGGAGKVDLAVAGGAGSFSSSAATNDGVLRAMTGKLHLQSGSGAAAITIASTGNVSIGGGGNRGAKLSIGGSGGSMSDVYGPYIEYGAIVQEGYRPGPISLGIWSNAGIGSNTGIYVTSDARIKNIEGVSNGAADLQTLLNIEITDYLHRDPAEQGGAKQKKVIAQQVEAVYPNAVKKILGIVPDIYQKAFIDKDWVSLETNLKVGEKVRLFNNGENDSIQEVLEVRPGAFRTAFMSEAAEVFVYGREVADLRSVDYDAISMLNVSATQELHRKIMTLEKEVAGKDLQIGDLSRRLEALEKIVTGTR